MEGVEKSPLFTVELLSKFLGADCWITEVSTAIQHNGIHVTQKLQLPSMDTRLVAVKFFLAGRSPRRWLGFGREEGLWTGSHPPGGALLEPGLLESSFKWVAGFLRDCPLLRLDLRRVELPP
ncbi:unnamed protein product [Symbiodinium pilosum]|uniref:Uncharacterized protein n=1 Tax=Symbiodinium pilosum TaxID=2952 RepID=A0A812WRQ3_SYMPI|nr:unnamed protein product [Symbiodinium pilosum]